MLSPEVHQEVFTFQTSPSSRLAVTVSERLLRGPFVASAPASGRVATARACGARGCHLVAARLRRRDGASCDEIREGAPASGAGPRQRR